MDKLPFTIPEGFPEHVADVLEFRVSLLDETDRGCALMVASFLDFKLEQLLIARLVDDSKMVSELLAHSGPLGTFSSRIDMAFALGLIGANVRRDLNLIRKIRNEFGHSHRPLMFSDDAISSRCNELFHFHSIESTSDPRKMYVKTTMAILALLNSALLRMEHLLPGKDLYPSEAERKTHQAEIQKMVNSLLEQPEEMLSTLMKGFVELLEKQENKDDSVE